MLHILLLIIKIIGVVLATILGIIILILLVPVSYKGKGDSKEKTKFCFVAKGLFHLIYFKFTWIQDEMGYVFRVLGIPVVKGIIGDKEEEEEDLGDLFSNFEDNIIVKLTKKEQKTDFLNRESEESSWHTIDGENGEGEEYIQVIDDVPNHNEQNTDKSYLRKNESRINSRIKKFISFLKRVPRKIKDIKKKIKKIRRFLKSKKTKMAFYYSKDILKKLYHHMKPSKLEANVTFGFESPDLTGKTLAILSVVYGTVNINPETFCITPDFQNKRLEGTVFLKGNFMLGYVLVQLIKWYFKKEVHDIIEKINA